MTRESRGRPGEVQKSLRGLSRLTRPPGNCLRTEKMATRHIPTYSLEPRERRPEGQPFAWRVPCCHDRIAFRF